MPVTGLDIQPYLTSEFFVATVTQEQIDEIVEKNTLVKSNPVDVYPVGTGERLYTTEGAEVGIVYHTRGLSRMFVKEGFIRNQDVTRYHFRQ